MGLQTIDPKGWKRVFKRRRRNERRLHRMQRAVRWNLHADSFSKVVNSISGIFRR